MSTCPGFVLSLELQYPRCAHRWYRIVRSQIPCEQVSLALLKSQRRHTLIVSNSPCLEETTFQSLQIPRGIRTLLIVVKVASFDIQRTANTLIMIQYATVNSLLWLQFDASQKSDETNPKWFMVDVKFTSRATHFVPYPLLREIAAGRVTQSAGIEYVGEEGVGAIKGNSMCHKRLKLAAIISIQRWI